MRHIADSQTAYCLMTMTKYPHSQRNIFTNQEKGTKNKDAHGDRRQDKRGETTARSASPQPARSHIPMRAEQLNTKTTRSQKSFIDNSRIAQLTLWVEPRVKAEVIRRATEIGGKATPSSVGAELLKRGIQVDLDMSYGALLTPVFENVLKRYMAARDNRMASLLVRASIAIEQTRSISVNTLGRQPAKPQNVLKPDVLNDILDRSLEDAKKKLTNRSPELKELIKELNSWIVDGEK
jgi:hypothetical protein